MLFVFATLTLLFHVSSSELLFVVAVFRHGDRTPIEIYPKDPHGAELWEEGLGQLTNIGKRDQYGLGKWLRERYDGFLPKKYNHDDIYVRSTDVDRTLMSGYCNLAGLYEPSEDNWSKELNWQPIPVHTTPKALDNILAVKKPCPKYDQLLKELDESEYFQAINKRYAEYYQYMTENSGWNITDVCDVWDLEDPLTAETAHGMELPTWAEKIYPEPVLNLSQTCLQKQCFTKDLCRLKVGPLVKEMFEDIDLKIKEQSKKKMAMYAGHDNSITNLLKGFGVYDNRQPVYSSLLLLEVRKDSDITVELYYRRNTTSEPILLDFPECASPCSWTNFKSTYSWIIPDDWENECNS